MNEDQQKRYDKMITMGIDPSFASSQINDTSTLTGVRERSRITPALVGLEAVSDIKEGFQGIKQSLDKRASKFAETTVQDGNAPGAVEAIAQGAGLSGDVIGELFTTGLKIFTPEEVEQSVSDFIAEKGENVANTVNPVTGRTLKEEIVNAQPAYELWAKDYPTLDASVRAVGNVGTVALELLGFKTAQVGTKVTAKAVKETAEKSVNGAESLKDVFKGKSLPSANDLLDKSIEGAASIAGSVQKIPAKVSESVKGSVTRNLIKTAQEAPEKAQEKIIDLYKRGIVPGVKKKNKTITNIKNIDEAVKRVVPALARKYDPVDIEDFANAINTEKKTIYSGIETGLGKAKGNIDTSKITEELKSLLKSERADLSADLKASTQNALDNLLDAEGNPKLVSPQGAQQIIADIHAELQSFYRGSTTAKNSDVVVKNLVLNNLKRDLDDLVKSAGGEFKNLKSQYADLKKLEDDVVHRAVFEAQKGNGLDMLTNVFSAGDVLGGTLGLNPAFLAKGVGQYFTKDIIKSLNDKNELIRQMFILGKNLPNTSSPKSKLAQTTPKASKDPSLQKSTPEQQQRKPEELDKSQAKNTQINNKSQAELKAKKEVLVDLEKLLKTKETNEAIKKLKSEIDKIETTE